MIPKKRIVFWSVIWGTGLCALVLLFWPRPILTDIAVVSSGTMRTTIDEEAKTEVKDIFTLSSPITGHLRRIELEVGDLVTQNETIVAEIEPLPSEFLDPRSEAQAKARVSSAASALELANAELEQALVEMNFAKSEYDRVLPLHKSGTVSQRDLDNAKRQYESRRAFYLTTQAAVQVRKFELEQVKAALMSPSESEDRLVGCECLKLRAPINGSVLSIATESEGVVSAGSPLIEIGDPSQLHVVAELLSTDAVKVQTGALVEIDNWGGDSTLTGSVARVDPIGFSKTSALGIEEQRVNVIIDLESPYEDWTRLGHGYQVDVAIVLWQKENVVQVPLTSIFRDNTRWAIYVVEQGKAKKRFLDIGKMNDNVAQVLSGLEVGEEFILYPSDRIEPGVAVSRRTST